MNKKNSSRRNNLGYYIKEGVSSIFTHGFMSFASVVIIVACLVIIGSFLLVALNFNEFIDEAESRNEVLAFIDPALHVSEAQELFAPILDDPNVYDVTFVTREEAWDVFTSAHPPGRFEGLDSGILRHRFVVDLVDHAEMQPTIGRLMHISGVEEVAADTEIAEWFVMFRNIFAGVFIAIAAVLLVISVFIISNTIKLATVDRREEIAIMRMVGAKNWFIRWPFIFQGFILGLTGAAFAFGLQWLIYGLITDQIMALGGALIAVISFAEIANFMILIFVATGFLVGTLGSAIAIRNYLKV